MNSLFLFFLFFFFFCLCKFYSTLSNFSNEQRVKVSVLVVVKAVFGSCKIFFGNAIFGKGKYFQVFGCIPKNALENIF